MPDLRTEVAALADEWKDRKGAISIWAVVRRLRDMLAETGADAHEICLNADHPTPKDGYPCYEHTESARRVDVSTAAAVIDAIEETFLAELPPSDLVHFAQEDVWAGLDALRTRFGVTDEACVHPNREGGVS